MKLKDIPTDLLLDSLAHLTPLEVDNSLRFVSHTFGEFVEKHGAQLPKRTIGLASPYSLKDGGCQWICYYDDCDMGSRFMPSKKRGRPLRAEDLRSVLGSARLGRISTINLREGNIPAMEALLNVFRDLEVDCPLVGNVYLKVPIPDLQGVLEVASKVMRTSCLRVFDSYPKVNPKVFQHEELLRGVPLLIYHFYDSYFNYEEMGALDFLLRAGYPGRVLFHLGPFREEQMYLRNFFERIITWFRGLRSVDELKFPKGGLLLIIYLSSLYYGRQDLVKVLGKPVEPILHIDSWEGGGLPGYITKDLRGSDWRVWVVRNPYLRSPTGGGGKLLRVMQRARGGDTFYIQPVHFEVLNEENE